MTILFRNNAVSTLANPVLTTDTLVVLATNTGSRFPAPVAGEWFYATIQSGVNYEIVKCTARAGDVLTVERAQDGTSLQSWNAGVSIDMRIPKIVLESFLQQNEIAKAAAGSAATPSLTFTGDTDTGIYNPGPNQIGMSVGGAQVASFEASQWVQLGNPSLTSSQIYMVNTGASASQLRVLDFTGLNENYAPLTTLRNVIETNGSSYTQFFATPAGSRASDRRALRMTIPGAGQIEMVGPVGVTSGTAAAPAYSFTGDTDTGIYQSASNVLDISAGGNRLFQVNNSGGNSFAVFDNVPGQTFTVLYLRALDASASNLRTGTIQALNESSIPVLALDMAMNTDGSSSLQINATPSGARNTDRRVNRMTIPGSGAISMVGPVNVTSGGQTVTGDLEASGNLRFNSGYGSAAIAYGVRAWANIDGTTLVNANGTYSQSGTTVTVSLTNHGLIVGHLIHADITSGAGVDGFYTVASVVDANTFTYIAGTSLTTSGNISLPRCVVRGAGNISNVVRVSTGDYAVNFAAAMPDANYMAIANVSHSSAGANATVAMMWTAGRFAAYCRFGCSDNNTDGYSNAAQIDFMVMR